MRKPRNPEIIAGTVNANGDIGSGEGFQCVYISAGKWTLLFPPNFRVTSVVITVAADALAFVTTIPQSSNSIGVRLYTSAGAVLAQPWSFVAVGSSQ